MSHPHAQHIKIIAIINLIFGGLGLLAALGILAFFVILGGAAAARGGNADAAAAGGVLSGLGLLFAMVVGVFSLPQLLGGWGLLTGRSWGKIIILILSALNILNVPLGTALGIYGFWALLHTDTDAAMASLDPDYNPNLYE